MNTTITKKSILLRTAMTLGRRLAMTFLLTLMTLVATAGAVKDVNSSTTEMTTGTYRAKSSYTISSRITITGEVTLIIDKGQTLTASNGIYVKEGATLTIEGPGELEAYASATDNCAGIGGEKEKASGTIIINGGNVTARGGIDAAGIGGGQGGASGTITINGGVVTATGRMGGAGIGGGLASASGTITINGGVVTATGGFYTAGIGGGRAGACGEITIKGGKVTATSDRGSGIGPGIDASPTVSGTGTLGWTNKDDKIYASNYNNVASLVLEDKFYFIEDNIEHIATADNIAGKTLLPYVSTLDDYTISGIQPRYLYTDNEIVITPEVYTPGGSKLEEGVDYIGTFSPSTIKDVGEYTYTITAVAGSGYIGSKSTSFSVVRFNMADAVIIGVKPHYLYTGELIDVDYTVTGFDGNPLVKGTDYTEEFSSSTIREKGDYTVTITAKSVGYYGSKTINFTVGDGIPVTAETTEMNSVHRVTNDVTIASSSITINGDVTLILDEGTTMNAIKGIHLAAGSKLTIKGKGTLNAASDYNGIRGVNGTLVIEDGVINAKGGYHAAGIGGGANEPGITVIINGGTVNATGGKDAAGIGGGWRGSCGTVVINGGKVTAIGGGNGAPGIGGSSDAETSGSITLGWTNEDDYIYASGYANVSSISFAEGKYFCWTENGETFGATVDNIGGKKIVPLRGELLRSFDYIAVSGMEPYYLYSGNEINIEYVVKDASGNELKKGRDFTESYSTSPVKDFGDYTLTLTAIASSGYTGSRVFSFTIGNGIPITSTTTELTGRYYSVPDDVTVSERITILGDVRLFLDEGKTLTASKGIELSKGNKLTIEGKGTLVATGTNVKSAIGAKSVGMLVINDGNISATGTTLTAGIGGDNYSDDGGTIIINGGKVTATGGTAAAGIGGGNVGVCGIISINGGKVTAKGNPGIGSGISGDVGGMITLGWTNDDDYIYASSYERIFSVDISNGQTLFDSDGNTYNGSLTDEQITAIGSNLLFPHLVVVPPTYTQDFSDGLSGWTIVDGVDGTEIYTAYSGANPNFRFYPSSSPQYLISPKLKIDAMVKLSLYAKIYVDNDEVAHPASFQIGFSPSTKNISDFIWGDVLTISDGSAQLVQAILPAETKYVAFKYVSGDWLFFDNISITKAVTNVTFAKEGFSTFYDSRFDLTLPAGVKAYIVTASEGAGSLTYQAIADGDGATNTVPKGTAVMLRKEASDAAQSIDIPLASPTAAAISETNLLHGSDTEITTTGGDAGAKYYKLSYGTNQTGNGGDDLTSVLGWFWGAADGAAFTSAAHKAWLVLPSTAGTRGFFGLPGDDETTLLRKVNSEEVNSEEWFSLDGRRLNGRPSAKGLYIHNGRKVVIK